MLYFTIQNRLQDGTSKVSEAAGARWRFCVRIILGLCSNYPRIVFLFIQGVSAEIWRFQISWQAHYLVRLQGDFTCSTHWKWRFICDADQWWHSFCVAGAVFGEVGGWLFMTGAALRDILGDSRDAKCCILQYKIVSKLGRVRSPKRRVRDDDFIVGYPRISSDILGYPRIMVESSFYWRKHFRDFPRKSWPSRFRGRRSIWWGWRVTWLAPRIGNDVSYVTQIIDDVHFAWQAQYLVRLEGDFTCSTHWKWRFICDADHSWLAFCVAGAVFGDVGGWLYLLHILEMTFHMWRRSVMTFILRGRRSIWWCWMVTLLARRIGNDVSYVTQISDDIHFAWQAQYLLMLEGDFTCSTHWKWRFICDADQWWHSFCVAGAVFGDVGGWLYLLHALEMTFQRSTGAVRCSTL